MDIRIVAGRNVRRLRLQAGLSQDDLADKAGLHTTYLSGIENGRRNITLVVLARLAGALGVSESVLLSREASSL